MKTIITSILLGVLFLFNLNATIYYIATDGSDSNPGTISEPWKSLPKAYDVVTAGDTVYIRGGTHYATWTDHNLTTLTSSGDPENPICFYGYPGEWPIIDGDSLIDYLEPNLSGNIYNMCVNMVGVRYIYFKNIEFRHFYQYDPIETGATWIANYGVIRGYNTSNLKFENIIVHDSGVKGFYISSGFWNPFDSAYAVDVYGSNPSDGIPLWEYDTTTFLNCDVYNMADPYSDAPGNNADAWKIVNYQYSLFTFTNCRAWNYSDDGFDCNHAGYKVFNNCWAMAGSMWDTLAGFEGNGFKITSIPRLGSDMASLTDTNIIKYNNCVVAYSSGGFSNDLFLSAIEEDAVSNNAIFYKNIAFGNDRGFVESTDPEDTISRATFYNNIGIESTELDCDAPKDIYIAGYTDFGTEIANNWDYKYSTGSCPRWVYTDSVTITADDFVTALDSATIVSRLTASRGDNWAMPAHPFELTSTSDLIDAGVDVGYDYYGSSPDMGAAEFIPIIADHTVVDKYDDIPEYYINEVKKMVFVMAGESHSRAYGEGLVLLDALDSTYNFRTVSYPDAAPITTALTGSGALWGDYDTPGEWVGSFGEEDWFTNTDGIAQIKTGLSYCNTNGYPIDVVGYGWCYDAEEGNVASTIDPVYGVYWRGVSVGSPEGDLAWGLDDADNTLTGNSVNMDSYIEATQSYIDYCADSIPTTVFFSTGPVDSYASSEISYQAYLKWERLRDYVDLDPSLVFFDYADILCYDDDGSPGTTTWSEYTYPHITVTNLGDGNYSHISQAGELRIAKATWWMLARIAGWDGVTAEAPEAPAIDSTANDIITFTLSSQTGSATINTGTHTVAITVSYGTNVTSLSPTITVSSGATISPLSGAATDFTSPVVYTVTSADETAQEWTVTVTEASNPNVTPGRVAFGVDTIINQGEDIKIRLQ